MFYGALPLLYSLCNFTITVQSNLVLGALVWVLQLRSTLPCALFQETMGMETFTESTYVQLLVLVAGFRVQGLASMIYMYTDKHVTHQQTSL